MQAVILAGGLGTRLRPITYTIPKAMVPIGDRPFLEHQIELLKKHRIKHFLLLTGYHGAHIRSHFKNGSAYGVKISYSHEETPQGTGGALKKAYNQLENRFILLYGDSYLPIDYGALIRYADNHNRKGVVVAYNNETDTRVTNNLCVGENGIVLRYEKDSARKDLNYVESGVLILRKEVVGMIPSDQQSSLEGKIFPQLILQGELIAYITKERFYDIGTPEGLLPATQYLKK